MKIPFEKKYRKRYYKLLDKVFDSNFLSDGPMNVAFENKFTEFTGLKSAAVTNGGAGLLALLQYVNVAGKDVIVPTNTFMATPLSVKMAGGNVVFADCRKDDLCLGVEQIKAVLTKNTKAVILVHIGGHLAFDSFKIAKFCKEKGLYLIEDCAHAHGAVYRGRSAGSFGIGGSYSFYATKTMPMGEGGVVASRYPDVIKFVKQYRNYGKMEYAPGKFKYPVSGFNFRLSEVMAALGLIQLERLPMILQWKRKLAKKYDQIFDVKQRVVFPKGMESGYYKYIVFDQNLKQKTGGVFEDLCHNLMGQRGNFPNSQWVAKHHACAPIYYGWDDGAGGVLEIKRKLF